LDYVHYEKNWRRSRNLTGKHGGYFVGDGDGVTNTVTVGIGVTLGLTGTNASPGLVVAPLTTTATTPKVEKFV
jgi:hypothetical protein